MSSPSQLSWMLLHPFLGILACHCVHCQPWQATQVGPDLPSSASTFMSTSSVSGHHMQNRTSRPVRESCTGSSLVKFVLSTCLFVNMCALSVT